MTETSTDSPCVQILGEYDGGHPTTEPFSLLGRSHATAILFYVVHEEHRFWRFSELEGILGISPNTLSNRLEELVDAGLLERRSYDEIPPRVEYTATQRALDLESVFEEFRDWSEKHGEATGLVEPSAH
jgi:DNA-binding HxlR family transcriptional regulator